jgi:uncharacterized Tic20 family protein
MLASFYHLASISFQLSVTFTTRIPVMLLRLACLLTALHKSLYSVNWRLTLTGTTLAESVFIIFAALHESRGNNSLASSETPI